MWIESIIIIVIVHWVSPERIAKLVSHCTTFFGLDFERNVEIDNVHAIKFAETSPLSVNA